MGERLLSVGLDVGTTTTQMVVSQLTVENQAGAFAVPKMTITQRQIRYRGKVQFTPLAAQDLVDGDALRELVQEQYRLAGICREDVDTGAVIITGETSRKENAAQVLAALADFAGDFVVATAGPDLESVLAAKGAGADTLSRELGKPVLHMDIGGGTSNLALLEDGEVVRTGCLNVGGRLLKFDNAGRITYVSPVLSTLIPLQVGDIPQAEQLEAVADMLVQALEMAAGLRPATVLLEKLLTSEVQSIWQPPSQAVISFSGGVADCIEKAHPILAFGDLGVVLGQQIRKSLLCRGQYALGTETIRATVIGAGSYSTQLSGSTVYYRNVALPLKNLPVAVITLREQGADDLPQLIDQRLRETDTDTAVLFLPGYSAATYEQVTALADAVVAGMKGRRVFVCLQADMAKALGHALQMRLGADAPCLCIDSLQLQAESFLDIGSPVGPCLPVVIKTLVLEKGK